MNDAPLAKTLSRAEFKIILENKFATHFNWIMKIGIYRRVEISNIRIMKTLKTLLAVPMLCVMLSGASLEAATVTLRTIGTTGTKDGTVTVPVTVAGFTDKLSMQFSLQWDQTVLQYSSIGSFGLPGGVASDFNVTEDRVNAGQLAMAWITSDGQEQSVADGTVVVNVTFTVIGETDTSSNIGFIVSPTATLIDDVPPAKTEGTVTVAAPADVVVNTAPTISAISDKKITQDTATSAIAFTVGDTATGLDSLVISKTSSNTEVVLAQDIVLGGSGASRTVTVTPVTGKIGFATISLTVTDGGGLTATESFEVTVGAPNKPPTITSVADKVIWDGATSTFSFTIGDEENSADQLTVTASSSNTDVIPAANLAITGTGASKVLAITPISGTEGATLVTLMVKDTDQEETAISFTVTVTKRRVYFVSSSGTVGSAVDVPIKLSAQGGEAGLSFSVKFDPTVLSSPNLNLGSGATGASLNVNSTFAQDGKIGVSLLLLSGTFEAGEQEVAVLSLAIGSGANSGDLSISFSDDPLERLNSTPEAISLEAAYQDSVITLATGLEGDVNPRPTGDDKVNLFDWVQTGRLAAKLDDATNPITTLSEFQRADTSPKSALGDGKINLFDWVQTGRYAAKLDTPIPTAGGPGGPFDVQSLVASKVVSQIAGTGTMLHGRVIENGSNVSIKLSLESKGNVAAAAFSLWLDPNEWEYLGTETPPDGGGSALVVNEREIGAGQLGFVMSQPPGQVYPEGRIDLLEIQLSALNSVLSMRSTIEFSDSPIEGAAASVLAENLELSFNLDGEGLNAAPMLLNQIEDGFLELEIKAMSGRVVSIETSEDLVGWRAIWSGEIPFDGRIQIFDENLQYQGQHFYRVVNREVYDFREIR